jgi:hypothetical protein
MENAVINAPHQPLYMILAMVYLLSCFGLDKVFVSALLTIGYAVLALSRK